MVKEISYEQYKEFCSMLACKDVFYYLNTLFLKYLYDDTIYAIKYPASSNIENLYSKLEKTGKITKYSLNEFKSGFSVMNNLMDLDEKMYMQKNVLIEMPISNERKI